MDLQLPTLLTHGWSVGEDDWDHQTDSRFHVVGLWISQLNLRCAHDFFLSEACSIINSRPLIPISTDPENPLILTPSTLLTQKSNVIAETYINTDVDQKDLLRKQWKRVQHLASIFWKRWKVEYLNTLHPRRKWNSNQRNVTTGDVVLIRDKELCRISWPIGLVVKAIQSDDGLVRKVLVRTIVDQTPRTYVRPVNELVLLVSC